MFDFKISLQFIGIRFRNKYKKYTSKIMTHVGEENFRYTP